MGLDEVFLTEHSPALSNRGDSERTFEIIVQFLCSKAKLGDGSARTIERETIVKLEVEFSEMDPQDLHYMEKAVKNWVEKIGESVV